MNTDNYFHAPEEVKLLIRRKLYRNLESLWIQEITDIDADEISIEDFFKRTLEDMLLFENYEGAQCLSDIMRYKGWK